MKLVAKAEATVKDDPRAILERSVWQRLRVAAEEEVLHPDWGTALYSLHRAGRINNDQREAGDRYAKLITDYRKLWRDSMLDFMVDDSLVDNGEVTKLVKFGLGHVTAESPDLSEFEDRRARAISKRYKEARAVAGETNRALEDLLMEDIWPVGEAGHMNIGYALTRLSHFFMMGTNRERRRKR